MNTNFIGLPKEKADKTAEKLNELLANLQIFSQNLRVLHWNIEGRNFFELHEKYGECYNTTADHIDEVAERVLQLGQRPLATFQSYIEKATITSVKDVTDGREGASIVLSDLGVLIKIERELLEMTDGTDEGTFSIISATSGYHEKNMWMFNAFLS